MSKTQKRSLLIEIDTGTKKRAKKCKIEQAKTNIIDVNKFASAQVPCSIVKDRNINAENLISIPLMISKTKTAKNVSNTQFTVHNNLIYLTGTPNTQTSKKLPERSLDLDEADLQILLQNFYKLEGDEQQLLISHLKKLENDKPDIVNNLKRFVRVAGPVFKIPEEKDDCESDLNDLDDLDDILEESDIIITNSDDESIVNVINNDNSTQPVETNMKSPVNHKKDCSSAEVNYETIYLSLDAISSSEEVKHSIIDLTVSPEPCEIESNLLSNLETLIDNKITEETESKISINDSSKFEKQEENLTVNITEKKEQKIKINLLSKQEKQDVNVIEEKENIVLNNTSIIECTNEEKERTKPEEPVQKIQVTVEPEAEIIEPKQDLEPTKAEIKVEISEFNKKEPVIKKEDEKQIDLVKIESVKKDPVIEKDEDKKIDIVKTESVKKDPVIEKETDTKIDIVKTESVKKDPAIEKDGDKKIDIVKTEPVQSDKKDQVIEKKDDKGTVQKLEEKDNKQIELKVEKNDDKQIELKEEKKDDKEIEKKDDKIIDQKVEQKDDKQTEQKDDKQTEQKAEKKGDKETGKKVVPPPREKKPQPPVNMKKNKKPLLSTPKRKRFPLKPVPIRRNSFHSRRGAMTWRNNDNHPAYDRYDCGHNKGYNQEFQDNYDHEFQDNYNHEYQDNYHHEFQDNYNHEFQNNYDHEYQDNHNWQRNTMEETYYHRRQERVQGYCHPERRAQQFGHRNHRNQQEMRQYFDRSEICTSGNFFSFN